MAVLVWYIAYVLVAHIFGKSVEPQIIGCAAGTCDKHKIAG